MFKTKVKKPCIRGLKHFEKGCPQRTWEADTGEGCPAWIELSVATRTNPLQREIKKQCIDLWTWEFQWAGLGVMEGVQQATEGNRNMTALYSLVMTGSANPEELIKIASKNFIKSKQALIEEAKGIDN